jgi:hypothetical protein
MLYEMMEEGSRQARRLAQVRDMAASAMRDLTEHQQKNGSIEAKSGTSNPAPATESQPQRIENQQRKTRQKTPTPVERPVRQNQRPSLPNAG